jgi:hypothetical protein
MPGPMSAEIKKHIVHDYASGVPGRELAVTYGVSIAAVYKWAERAGLRRTNRGTSSWSEARAETQLAHCEQVVPTPKGPVPTLFRCPMCDGPSDGRAWHPTCRPAA